jgi:hypothetical protein
MLLVASSLMATDTRSDRFFERYLMLGIPVAAIAFACWAENGRPLSPLAVVLAVLVVVLAARVPVSQYLAGQGAVDSPTLLAVLRLQRSVGIGGASLLVALAATAAAAVGALAAVGRVGPRGALLLSASILAVVSAGAHSRDHRATDASLGLILGGTANWVDRAVGDREALLVESTREFPAEAMLTALRNISITRMGLIGTQARTFDGAAERITTTGTGILRLDGTVVRQPLVVDQATTQLVFANAPARAAAGTYVLVQPEGPARLALMTEGLYEDGWLSSEGRLTLFGTGRAGICRTASLSLRLPRGARPVTVTFSSDGVRQVMHFRPGASRDLRVRGAVAGPTSIALSATPVRWTSDPRLRTVSVRAVVRATTAPCPSAAR